MVYTDEQLTRLLAACRSEAGPAKAKVKNAQEPAEEPVPECASAAGRLSISQQTARVEAAIQQQRIEQRKEGCRASAKWLEENFPEDFGERKATPRAEQVPFIEARSSDICLNSAPAREAPRVEPQGSLIAPVSPQSVPATLPVQPPIPPLASGFWQGVLFGSRDALVPATDANIAVQLVARELGVDFDVGEFADSVRVNTLRKLIDERFGVPQAWLVMKMLWRAAPASPGGPTPNEDQSQLTPGPMPSAGQPRWVRGLSEPGVPERVWMIENGLWCG
jgi:hypothetical protein